MEKSLTRKYIRKLISLNKLHKKIYGNAHIDVPVLLSESLCKFILKLKDKEEKDKSYDAVDNSGLKYEIKATSGKEGKTTYNPHSKVDFLVWMFFDFDNKIINIKKTNYDDRLYDPNFGSNRKNITLSTLEWDELKIISMKSLKAIKRKKDNDK